MTQTSRGVAGHYGRSGLGEAILQALRDAGKDPERFTLDDLAAVDEFHIRGRQATEELVRLAAFTAGARVLDVGCGIGGPSRQLAQACGCKVTGLDLTAEYCHTARMITERTGLDHLVDYHQGDALDMPFEDRSFDGVWTQHVTMNIPDKEALFRECRRVLRPGGRIALYEILANENGGGLHYPVPWAREPSISFVATEPAMRRALAAAGFEITVWNDVTRPGQAWFAQMLDRVRTTGRPPIGLHLLLGADFGTMAANVLRNLEEERLSIVQVVAEG